jgi:hypothetical protein
MFNLEQSLAQWRQQMLAAGIKSPATLEELESHLREEIERQKRSGIDARQAFETTILRIGQPEELKIEFAKGGGLFGFLGYDKFTRTNRILGTLWLVFSALSVARIFRMRAALFHPPWQDPKHIATFFIVISLLLVMYLVGMFGSILLLRGAKWGRHIIRVFATFSLLCGIVLFFKSFSVRESLFTAFFLVSVWFLFSQPTQKSQKAPE